jgi:hypothetical protein
MSKILAYVSCHYGKDYLGYAIRSIYPFVDKILILYTPKPSYGHHTELVNPDNEKDIRLAAFKFGDPDHKIKWMEGQYGNEGQHRHVATEYAQNMGYDTVMALDYDEIWDHESIRSAIQYVINSDKKIFRVPMIHFWRSFNYVCRDLAQPVRFTKLSGEGDAYVPLETPVYHFGYAIPTDLLAYKSSIHGHKDEWRENWFNEVWLADRRTDVHPTCEQDFWTPEDFDKRKLPKFMRKHPFYNLEVIR